MTASAHSRCLSLQGRRRAVSLQCQTPVLPAACADQESRRCTAFIWQTYCLSSLLVGENCTPSARATSRMMKKPVTPQNPDAMMAQAVQCLGFSPGHRVKRFLYRALPGKGISVFCPKYNAT